MNHYLNNVETTFKNLSTGELGLTEKEAQKRLLENGKNELVKAKKKSLLRRFLEQLINPMVLILLVAAAV